jgi:hypothetical protein
MIGLLLIDFVWPISFSRTLVLGNQTNSVRGDGRLHTCDACFSIRIGAGARSRTTNNKGRNKVASLMRLQKYRYLMNS